MKILLSLPLLYLLCSALAYAEPATVNSLQKEWALIKYESNQDQKEAAFEALEQQAAEAVAAQPQNAELLIWHGIILSSWAGEKRGLGALSLVKKAKEELELALSIDDKALSGSAYTSLGALYYQVPGWPIGFGNKKKAQELLEQGLQINPDGIDSNFFYGDFLASQHENKKARDALQHATAAPNRPGRTLADKGRRQEINELLAKIEE